MYTVVVADDEEELRKSLIRRVKWESIGFQVVGEAESGVDALELVEKLEPDLLLSDIRMPFMSGIDLARAAREICPTMNIAFLSGFDEFSYAQQAIEYNIISYMLKPISAAELTEELMAIKKKIDEKFRLFTQGAQQREQQSEASLLIPLLLDSFQGKNSEAYNRQSMSEAVKLGFVKNARSQMNFTVMVTRLCDGQGNDCTTPASINPVQLILKKYVRQASFFINGRVVSLMAATTKAFDKYLHIIVEEISQSTKRILGLSASIGVSSVVPQFMDIHDAYVEAMNALEYAAKEDKVSYISDIERLNKINQKTIQTAVNEIEGLIRSGTDQKIKEYIRHLFEWMGRGNAPKTFVQCFIIQISAALFRTIYSLADGDALKEILKKSPMQPYYFEQLQLLQEQCLEFCLYARQLVSEQRKKSSEVLCDRALELIEARYMDQDLSLVQVSKEISVSPNYLSALVKKTTGHTFVDLLTTKRLETAKGLLLNTELKIGEISELCGYNDQNYFSYSFKKYTGSSPVTCRRQHAAVK